MLRSVLIAATVGFLALAQGAVAAPVLPDLVADRSDGAYLERSPAAGGSPADLRLRFNGYVHNDGVGPLEVRGDAALVEQRVYEAGLGSFVDQPLPGAQLSYEQADGHQHTHLQRIARYSLVELSSRALVAPAQKVGFCLLDSEPRRELRDAYEYDPGSCFPADRKVDPNGPVRMGVSAGWRDFYDAGLTHQWVLAGDVQPGDYMLRAEIDPDGLVDESDELNVPADRPVTIPGYRAEPATVDVSDRHPWPVPLAATAYTFTPDGGTPEALGVREFRVDALPENGTLNVPQGVWFRDGLKYTPDAAANVTQDRIMISARDASSSFPRAPATAATTLLLKDLGPPEPDPTAIPTSPAPPTAADPFAPADPVPALAISGAPAQIVAGTAVQLSANAGEVEWSVDGVPGGSDATGKIGATGLLSAAAKAPASGAMVVGARSGDRRASVRVAVVAAAPPRAAPAAILPARRKPQPLALAAVRSAGLIAVTALPARSGRLRITVTSSGRRLGGCVLKVKARRTYACRVRQPRGRQGVGVVGTLRGVTGRVDQRRLSLRSASRSSYGR